jgi:hypothetical protein
MAADSLAIRARSSAAVRHFRTALMRSLLTRTSNTQPQPVSGCHKLCQEEGGAGHRREQVLSMRPTSLAIAFSSVSASFTAARASLTASMVGAGACS